MITRERLSVACDLLLDLSFLLFSHAFFSQWYKRVVRLRETHVFLRSTYFYMYYLLRHRPSSSSSLSSPPRRSLRRRTLLLFVCVVYFGFVFLCVVRALAEV